MDLCARGVLMAETMVLRRREAEGMAVKRREGEE